MPLFQVFRNLGAGSVNNSSPPAALNTMAQQVVMQWYQFLILDGRGYQVRAGTITTPLIGDVPITDTRGEFCVDAVAGTTIMPVNQIISVRLSTGTLHEYATKSVGTVSSAGTAFVPLPLKTDGSAAVSTARVQAHAVTVTAELATTTRRHWSWANPAAGFTGALPGDQHQEWHPAMEAGVPVLVGPQCLYTQIAAASTGPSYYANLDFIEVPSLMVNPS